MLDLDAMEGRTKARPQDPGCMDCLAVIDHARDLRKENAKLTEHIERKAKYSEQYLKESDAQDALLGEHITKLEEENAKLKEENKNIKENAVVGAMLDPYKRDDVGRMISDSVQKTETIAELHADAAAMREVMKPYLEWLEKKSGASVFDTVQQQWQVKRDEVRAALSGDAGKELLERHAELAEWAEGIAACDYLMYERMKCGCDVDHRAPEWL